MPNKVDKGGKDVVCLKSLFVRHNRVLFSVAVLKGKVTLVGSIRLRLTGC